MLNKKVDRTFGNFQMDSSEEYNAKLSCRYSLLRLVSRSIIQIIIAIIAANCLLCSTANDGCYLNFQFMKAVHLGNSTAVSVMA